MKLETNKKIDKSLISILATPLRIREDKALPILMAYSSLFETEKNEAFDQQLKENFENSKIAILSVKHNDSKDFKTFESETTLGSGDVSTFKDAIPGSIVIIQVMGIMMRETNYSYRYGYIVGTRELEGIIKEAEISPNISSIIIKLKSPGGEAAGNESLARVINYAKANLPILVSFEGMASAALEAFIGATEIYGLEKDSYFGSLGTLSSVVDDRKFWDDMGVKFIDIYAPQSTEKNIESRSALDGDNKPMEDRLAKSTDFFIKDVKSARPQIIDDGKIYKGALYNAVEALKIKAIDGIKDFDFVINRAAFLARQNVRNNSNKKMITENEDGPEKVKKETVEMTKEDKTLLLFDKFKAFFSGSEQTKTVEQTESQKNAGEIGNLKSMVTLHEKSVKDLTSERDGLSTRILALEQDKKYLDDAKTLESEQPYKSVMELVEAYNKVFDHNKELGGDGKAPNLPVADKETKDVLDKFKTDNSPKTLLEREADIEKSLKAKAKAKESKTKE